MFSLQNFGGGKYLLPFFSNGAANKRRAGSCDATARLGTEGRRDRRTASAADSGWTADLHIEKSLVSSASSHFNRTGCRCNWKITPEQQAGPAGPATRPSDCPHELAWSGVVVPGTGLCTVSLRATTDGSRPLAAPVDAVAACRGV